MFGLLIVPILLLLPIQLGALNKTGHYVVASIAYDNLTASTKMRTRAKQLSSEHPLGPMTLRVTHGSLTQAIRRHPRFPDYPWCSTQ